VPFQNNTFFNVGPYGRTENGLLIQPVIPFKLNENWNLITRTIVPVIYEPQVSPSQGSDFGLGNINPQFFLSPARSGQIIWGGGPQLWLPTATSKSLGINKFGGGPAVVALTKRGHWLVGTLVGNVWAGTGGTHYNQMTITPLVFYNMQKGWYVMYVANMTANWVGSANDRWTVPLVLARKMRRRLQLKMRRKTSLRIRSACRSRTTPFSMWGRMDGQRMECSSSLLFHSS